LTLFPYGFTYGTLLAPAVRRPATTPALMPAPSQKYAAGAFTFGIPRPARLPVMMMLPKNVPSCFG
jgi:hypothetical protein